MSEQRKLIWDLPARSSFPELVPGKWCAPTSERKICVFLTLPPEWHPLPCYATLSLAALRSVCQKYFSLAVRSLRWGFGEAMKNNQLVLLFYCRSLRAQEEFSRLPTIKDIALYLNLRFSRVVAKLLIGNYWKWILIENYILVYLMQIKDIGENKYLTSTSLLFFLKIMKYISFLWNIWKYWNITATIKDTQLYFNSRFSECLLNSWLKINVNWKLHFRTIDENLRFWSDKNFINTHFFNNEIHFFSNSGFERTKASTYR